MITFMEVNININVENLYFKFKLFNYFKIKNKLNKQSYN